MTDSNPKLPKNSNSKYIDEKGLFILNELITEKIGWLFRKNHLEDDYGIDGYIDIITEKRGVTGKSIAFQLKTGKSYFNEENEIGYVYRDDFEHLNYYLNLDIPVLIIIVNPETKIAHWEIIKASKTESTGKNWKITIPKNQLISEHSKEKLKNFTSPVTDYVSQLKEMWSFNKLLTSGNDRIILKIPRNDIEKMEFQPILNALQRFISSKDLILKLRNKIDISFDDYDADERELYEIPEVNKWISGLFNKCDCLPYLLTFDKENGFAEVLLYSQVKIVSHTVQANNEYKIKFNADDYKLYIFRIFSQLSDFCNKHGLNEKTIDEISYLIKSFYNFK